MSGHWSTARLKAALNERYSPPEAAIFFEVANATGFDARRHADAVSMGLWPSRGLLLEGHEIKCDRRDWQRELANPAKVEESCFRFMDRWWIVAAPGVVKDGELPPTWGLLEPRGDKLVSKVEAPKLEPKPITRVFLAALLRRADEHAHKASREEIEAAKDDARKAACVLAESSAKARYERPLLDLRETVKTFQEASGVDIDRWNAGRIGDAVRRVLAHDRLNAPERLQKIRDTALRVAAEIDEVLVEPVQVPT